MNFINDMECEYNDVLNKLQNYILNEQNMVKSLEQKLNFYKKERNEFSDKKRTNNEDKSNHDKLNNTKLNKEKYTKIYTPNIHDTLFWCLYIIKNGETKFELLHNKNIVLTKQLKIEYVEKMRKQKQLIKTYKFSSLTNIENNLANDNNINIETFMSLCVMENMNIIFVNNKTFFELLMNDTNETYIVYNLNNNNSNNKYNNPKYGFELGDNETISKIKNTLYKIDNISKPIKAVSFYKVQDLVDICMKIGLETIDSNSKKIKSKKDLYESIIQYF
jgi:hypothetical protein